MAENGTFIMKLGVFFIIGGFLGRVGFIWYDPTVVYTVDSTV